MNWLVLNLHASPTVTNTSLFALLLQSGCSSTVSSLIVPDVVRAIRLRRHFSGLLSRLYFTFFPPLSLSSCRRKTWSGSPAWEPCLSWAVRGTTSRMSYAPCRRNWKTPSLWWLSCPASWLSSRNRYTATSGTFSFYSQHCGRPIWMADEYSKAKSHIILERNQDAILWVDRDSWKKFPYIYVYDISDRNLITRNHP